MYLTNVKEKMGKWFKMAGVLKGNQPDFVRHILIGILNDHLDCDDKSSKVEAENTGGVGAPASRH
ncbi:MAG TPA: hypothetical protein PKD18_11635 [Saprospiraceae bacterium]|nr:hypothetical protein [Saprospiraceae bacterium]